MSQGIGYIPHLGYALSLYVTFNVCSSKESVIAVGMVWVSFLRGQLKWQEETTSNCTWKGLVLTLGKISSDRQENPFAGINQYPDTALWFSLQNQSLKSLNYNLVK